MNSFPEIVMRHINSSLWVCLMVFITALAACDSSVPQVGRETLIGDINPERLANIMAEPGSWLTGGRDFQQSYYSPLKSINKTNVSQLGFAWQHEIDTTHGFEATPIVVDGVMFGSGPKGAVYSLDAKTGELLWKFEPTIDQGILRKVCCGLINRGVAVWKGKVYVASIDGFLYALDAGTGTVSWKVDTITERDRGYTITGAPYIAKDVVVIGNSGAELDARGYVTAYDLKNGQQRWRFFTVPGRPDKGFEHPEMEMAAKTWDPRSLWQVGLGGTVWDGMAYDPELNLLYIGTGNAAPYPRKLRSPAGGDNLFLSSIIAINPDNGRMVWYYQTTPADNWDFTATQKMILADLVIEGQTRKVIMQAPKNGFFYVLDRITGELLSAKPYVQVTWASHVDKATGKPVETDQAEYFDKPKLIFPGPAGGHNWQPMSFSSETGLVYIPAIELPAIFTMPEKPFVYQKGGMNYAADYIYTVDGWLFSELAKRLPSIEAVTEGQPDHKVRGFLKAWDPIKERVVWEVETSGQWVGNIFASWNGGGVMTTAGGLLFQGRATGNLVIMDAHTGKALNSIDVGTSMMAAPMTYSVDGEQYVAIMAGLGGAFGKSYQPLGSAAYKYGNQGRIVAFKLGGGEVPKPPLQLRNDEAFPMPPLARRGTPAQAELGGELFQRNCSKCHLNQGGSGIPDLRKMSKQTHTEFLDIVLNGARADQGMGSFKDLLSNDQAESIHAFLIDLAWGAYIEEHYPSSSHQPETPSLVEGEN